MRGDFMNIVDLFQKGQSFSEFVDQDKDTYKEKTLELYEKISVSEELIKKIKGIKKIINVLVFAEIWCPDCMINVPVLQKITEINPNIKMSIVSREGNEAYMDSYKFNGKPKIPTFVFLNETYEELGTFIEQPQIVKDVELKGKQVEIIVAKRKYRKGEFYLETMEEIMDIIG